MGLGYKKSDLVGKALKNIYSSESIPKFKKIFSDWKKTGKIKDEELIILTKKGEKRTVLLSANSIRDKKKHIISLVYVQKDITEHKKIDNRLRLLMAAVKEAPDGVLVMDLKGVITYSNKAMERIYGFSIKDNLGKNINNMNIYSEVMDNTIISVIKKRGRFSGEVEVTHKDGHRFFVLLTASMVKNKKGKPMAMVSIVKDVTKRKKAENALKEKVEELERINKLMIGRELKMIELKREIARLKKSAKILSK